MNKILPIILVVVLSSCATNQYGGAIPPYIPDSSDGYSSGVNKNHYLTEDQKKIKALERELDAQRNELDELKSKQQLERYKKFKDKGIK